MMDWRNTLTDRQRKDLAVAEHYVNAMDAYGMPGHSWLVLIDQLATMLDAAMGSDEPDDDSADYTSLRVG